MLHVVLWVSLVLAQDDPWGLVRVDEPDHPDAIATSRFGSVLASPPAQGTPWRIEEAPDVHEFTGDWDAWEGADAMDVQPWHDAGFTGEGVKLAVFDIQWFGAEQKWEELGVFETWDCWAHPGCVVPIDTFRPRFSYESGGHGVACAEVVRDIAPGVELHLVRTNGVTTFENATDWAIREGIDVVTLSMSFMNSSFYDGTGAVSDVVTRLTEGGVLLVTSSGNYAGGHWTEAFTDAEGDGRHDFPWGSEYLPVRLRAGKKRGLAVHWDNYASCGDTDLDLWLYDEDGNVLDIADNEQTPEADRCAPVERLAPTLEEDQWTYLQVRKKRGDGAVRWNLITTSGQVFRSMPQMSVTDPGTHPLAFTVGAVPAIGYLHNPVESFSSHGPNMAGDQKPDIAAPDGVTTSTYGPTAFYGTSAASPAAAAAIALVMSRYPEMDAFDARDWLVNTAWSETSTWQEPSSSVGAGHLRLPPPEGELPGCGGRALGFMAVLGWPLWGLRRREEAL
jgi:hypothetical protein